MGIASRTPEGAPNRCPICGKDLVIEPSKPTMDAPCPHCGHLLWFHAEKRVAPEGLILDRQSLHQTLIHYVLQLATVRLGPPGPSTRAEIESIVDAERLRALISQAATCASWEDLVNP